MTDPFTTNEAKLKRRAEKCGTAFRKALAEQQEPVAKVISTAPERIWLDLGFDPEVEDEVSFDDLFDATWSHDNATGNGIEYVRADLAPAQRKPLTDEQLADFLGDEYHAMTAEEERYFRLGERAAHGIKGDA